MSARAGVPKFALQAKDNTVHGPIKREPKHDAGHRVRSGARANAVKAAPRRRDLRAGPQLWTGGLRPPAAFQNCGQSVLHVTVSTKDCFGAECLLTAR